MTKQQGLEAIEQEIIAHSSDGRRSRESVPALRALLVSDLVGFTATVQALGDRKGLEYIRAHNAMLRSCLRAESGHEVAHTGDGMIMSFANAASALRCALRIQRLTTQHNLRSPQLPMRIRIGLHAGHPHEEEDRLFGMCVNVVVRVCSVSMPEQVLVSSTLRSLLDLTQYKLSDRGSVSLRGVRDPVQVYDFDWRQTDALHGLPLVAAA